MVRRFFWLYFLLFSISLSAQDFGFKNYSVGDGLAQSQVYSILQDSRGIIWLGTRGGGLSSFDGKYFKTYTIQDGLASNYISSIFEDSKQNIWIGTSQGLNKFNGYDFEQMQGLEKANVFEILEDADGVLWFASNRGIFLKKQNLIQIFQAQNVNTIYQDSQNQIWIANRRGLSKYQAGKIEIIQQNTQENLAEFHQIQEAKNGNLWLGTYGKGLFLKHKQGFSKINFKFPKAAILDLFRDSKDNIWFATQNNGAGFYNPNDSSFTYFTEEDGLANNHVRCIMEDDWGNIWLGTSGGGISKYAGQQFTHFDKNAGLKGNYIYTVFQDGDGQIWMGNSGRGVSKFDGNALVNYNSDSGFADVKVKAIFQDSDCKMYFGTDGTGLWIYTQDTFVNYTISDGLPSTWIRDVAQDKAGNIWLATLGGGIACLLKMDSFPTQKPQFKVFNSNNGLPDNVINKIHIDKKNRIWFATRNSGIGFIQKNKVQLIQKKDGLSSNSIRCLSEDHSGNLWIGTAEAGVNYFYLYTDSAEIKSLNRKNGLASNNIYLMTFDSENHLWIGSETGLDFIKLNQNREIIGLKHFGKSEGFTGIETTQNAVCRDFEGNLWFGTIAGLTKYKPGSNLSNTIPPKLQITKIALFYEDLKNTTYDSILGNWNSLKKPLLLPHDQNHLGFDFQAVNLPNPEKTFYQWKLEGSEENWSPVSKKNHVDYSNLPPGKYRFLVKSANEEMVWNKKPIEIKFEIEPPFWEKTWFKIAGISLLLLFVLLIFLGIIFRIKSKAKAKQKKLMLEKDMIELEQKALRLQMNPHFIFNALNSIQAQISRKDEKTARYYLAKFSKLMRAILENSRQNLIPLSEEITTLEDYLTLEKFSSNQDFDFEITLDESIDPDEIAIPSMMIQPFVENSIIHGLKNLDRKGKIQINFNLKEEILHCSIIDNGIGRTAAKKIKAQENQKHKSTALLVTQERLDRINNNSKIDKSLEINDLYDEKGVGSGTKILLRVLVGE